MSGSGDKRARVRTWNEDEERERKRLKTFVEGKNYTELLPEVQRIVHAKLPLYAILNIMETQRAFQAPEFKAAFWHELCVLEYKSLFTGRPYRYLTNMDALFRLHLERNTMQPKEIPAFAAEFWRRVYLGGSVAIRVVLMILQHDVNPVVTQSNDAMRKMFPQDDDILKQLLTDDDDFGEPVYANKGNHPVALPPHQWIHVFGKRRDPTPYNAAFSTDRNNWLAIGDPVRRLEAAGSYLTERPWVRSILAKKDPPPPSQNDAGRPMVGIHVFGDEPDTAKHVVLLTRSSQWSSTRRLAGALRISPTPVPHEPTPRIYRWDSNQGRLEVVGPLPPVSRNSTFVRLTLAPYHEALFLAQYCGHEGLELKLLANNTRSIPLVGAPGEIEHEVRFTWGARTVMSGTVMFGYEIRVWYDDADTLQAGILIERAYFLRAIDLDALVDWFQAQSEQRGLISLLELRRQEARFAAPDPPTLGKFSRRLAQRLAEYWGLWNKAYPKTETGVRVLDPLWKQVMYKRGPLIVELALWDLGDLMADLRSTGIQEPVQLLIDSVKEPFFVHQTEVHFTQPQ